MPLPIENRYTYADYVAWDTEERYELLNGSAVLQARPSVAHQTVSGNLFFQLKKFLADKPCKVYQEIEVLLPESDDQKADDVTTVFVPDLTVVCDLEQMHVQYCLGAPDLVVEILSPSTARTDRIIKMNAYQQSGVREYWLVSPMEQTVQIFSLTAAGHFAPSDIYMPGTAAPSNILPGFALDTRDLFV